MTSLSRVAFVGLGEAGQMFAGEFAARGGLQISAFDLAFDQEGSAQAAAAKAIGIRTAPTAAEAVAGAQLVISAVTASSDLDAARSVVGHLLPGAYFRTSTRSRRARSGRPPPSSKGRGGVTWTQR
jgi:3-hydroxyisobutyrate dehydrogenase-like beta-hydroxyacid dehydrogenase